MKKSIDKSKIDITFVKPNNNNNNMKQPIYTVTAKMIHEESKPIDGTSQTFMNYSEALTYFHDLCIRNQIIPQKWIQTPLQMTASSKDHKIELQIINF